MSNGVCPSCRRTLSENAKFCIECGSRIDFQMTRKELEDSIIEKKRFVFNNWEDVKEEEEPLEERIISETLKVVDSEENIRQIAEISDEKLPEQIEDVPPAVPLMDISEKKENRIITSSVGGGFKKRAPQAEEIKNVMELFGKKSRNN